MPHKDPIERKQYQRKYYEANRGTTSKIATLTTELTNLRAENATFRNAQKACEDCDAPTMAEVNKLRELVAAADSFTLPDGKRLLRCTDDKLWRTNFEFYNGASGKRYYVQDGFATAIEAFSSLYP